MTDTKHDSKKNEFDRGYVIACCNLNNALGKTYLAALLLEELGITQAELDAVDLTEYDLEAIEEMKLHKQNWSANPKKAGVE